MTAMADNPAALAPRKELTRRQQEAVLAIGEFRHIRKVGTNWEVGPYRFSVTLVDALVRKHLAREASRSLSLTMAGQLVRQRLEQPQ